MLAGAANGDIKIFNIIDGSTARSYKTTNGLIYKLLVIDYEDRSKEELLKKKKKLLVGSKKEQTLKRMLLASSTTTNISDGFGSPKLKSFTKNSQSAQKSAGNSKESGKSFGKGLSKPKEFIGLSERKSLVCELDYEEEFTFISASFDGTLNLWESSENRHPIFSAQGKNFMDASPFGGLEVFKNSDMNLLQIVTSGNKNDPTLNVWILK